jgi:hypothetical protein
MDKPTVGTDVSHGRPVLLEVRLCALFDARVTLGILFGRLLGVSGTRGDADAAALPGVVDLFFGQLASGILCPFYLF